MIIIIYNLWWNYKNVYISDLKKLRSKEKGVIHLSPIFINATDEKTYE